VVQPRQARCNASPRLRDSGAEFRRGSAAEKSIASIGIAAVHSRRSIRSADRAIPDGP